MHRTASAVSGASSTSRGKNGTRRANERFESSQPVRYPFKLASSLTKLVLGAVVAAGLSYVLMKTAYPIFVVPPEIAFVPETAPLEAQLKLESDRIHCGWQEFLSLLCNYWGYPSHQLHHFCIRI